MSFKVDRCGQANLKVTPDSRGWGTSFHRREINSLWLSIAPVLQQIKDSGLSRETNRKLPFNELTLLNKTRFPLARLPLSHGGHNATLSELFELVILVAEADPNVAHALRSHIGFVEHIITVADPKRRTRWLERLVSGDVIASAATENGSGRLDSFGTTLKQVEGKWLLNGTKAYVTGALFSDWIEVEATSADKEVAVVIPRSAEGVTVRDDWDGMGQRLSANGTAAFENVLVEADEIVHGDPFPYYESFYQLYLLAVLAGVGRAASNDVSEMLASRTRTFSHGAPGLPRNDPQLLQVVGEVRSLAYTASAAVIHASHALDRAYDNYLVGSLSRDLIALADIEVWQAQQTVTDLVLSATTRVFDALGASATRQEHALDRHWRNARTLASHNPVAYKARIVGDYAVNGSHPPGQWRVGTPFGERT